MPFFRRMLAAGLGACTMAAQAAVVVVEQPRASPSVPIERQPPAVATPEVESVAAPEVAPEVPETVPVEVLPVDLRPRGQPNVSGRYVLQEGDLVHEALARWAADEGWKLIWLPGKSWRVAQTTSVSASSVSEAVGKVVEYLREEGKPLQLIVYGPNRVLEVQSLEVGQ